MGEERGLFALTCQYRPQLAEGENGGIFGPALKFPSGEFLFSSNLICPNPSMGKVKG